MIFDCNVQLGRRTKFAFDNWYDVPKLKAELAYYGIDKALVYSPYAREVDCARGNELLAEAVAQEAELVPCAVAIPEATGEFPGGAELLETFKRQGVKAVRLFPGECNFTLAEWCAGELLTTLELARLPVLLEPADYSPQVLYDLCKAHPALPVILLRVGYRSDRWLYPLLRECANLYVETSAYQVHRGLYELAKRFGAERLIFGTGAPEFEPGVAQALVAYSGLSAVSKALVFGGNLERLVSEVRL